MWTEEYCKSVLTENICKVPCEWKSGKCEAPASPSLKYNHETNLLPRLEELYDIADSLEWAKVYSFVRDFVLPSMQQSCGQHAVTAHAVWHVQIG